MADLNTRLIDLTAGELLDLLGQGNKPQAVSYTHLTLPTNREV